MATPNRSAPRTQRPAPRPNKPKKNTLTIGSKIGISVILLLAVVAICVMLFKPKTIKQVSVAYTQSARLLAQQELLGDDDFIRNSGVVGKNINEISELEASARDSIAKMGSFMLTSIQKNGTESVELNIDSREPIAVVSVGGTYFYIDKDKYLLNKTTKKPADDLIIVNGLSLRNLEIGQEAVDGSTDGRLENAIEVIKALIETGTEKYFTEIYMQDNKYVYLISTYSIPVKISLWFKDTLNTDISAAVNIVMEYANKGLKGEVIAVNGNCYWQEDEDYFTPIKGN